MSGSQPPAATPSAGAADPSMEDILASIRRILSEDEPAPAAAATPPLAEPEPPEEDDVLVLDASMEVAEAPSAAEGDDFNPPPLDPSMAAEPEPELAPVAPVTFEAPEPTPIELPPPMAEPAPVAPPRFVPDLMAPETTEAAASSVSGLMRTLASERLTRVYGGGPTIEDLVREELRPLLKHWLDANLPDLVERLVRAEIERVVRRAVP
ncbi:MAG: DUF2497 domain-containing protein [Acetobacteraceae bacterium]|nr:DUF2497 domain-containing protein [Acetobacteraceae bacterium]